jgi:GMP synthase (glutamine-hydrolysing)
MHPHSNVVIVDYGSQYTQLIARRVRELGIHSIVVAADSSLERIQSFSPRAVVLSGGPSSVYDLGAPTLPKGFLDWQEKARIPVLGVCYGMQLLAEALGGKVERAEKREYGRMPVRVQKGTRFFGDIEIFEAWMSHGDETVRVPAGFIESARSSSGALAAMENPDRILYALQFHPEVTHTEHGVLLLKRFFIDIAKVPQDWTMRSVIEDQIEAIRKKVGPSEHVICALSGGVDSTVAAVLVHRAIGERLHCVFVDHGLLRFEEQKRVMQLFTDQLHLPVHCVDASDRFLSKLKGVEDPETKRKIIGAEFIAVFDEQAQQLQSRLGHLPRFLVQGTLYPDVIESSPPPGAPGEVGSGRSHSAKIKSHHNVGGLPKDLRFELIEPLRDLFKDEVRAMGRELGVPDAFLKRHPFPGPGLAVRIIGDIDQENIRILQQADEIFIQELKASGLYDQVWQAFAVFLPIRSVGVQGDGRTHDYVIALRAVSSSDGMTADWVAFEPKFLARVSSRICNEVRGVNRVVYDVSSKPPATIEWE